MAEMPEDMSSGAPVEKLAPSDGLFQPGQGQERLTTLAPSVEFKKTGKRPLVRCGSQARLAERRSHLLLLRPKHWSDHKVKFTSLNRGNHDLGFGFFCTLISK